MLRSAAVLTCLLTLASCKRQPTDVADVKQRIETESKEGKRLLQGIWLESTTEEVSFRAEGDTIYYADGVSQPTRFRIIGDSLELGSQRYPILKQSEYQFWFQNQGGDIVKLRKSESADDTLAFVHRQPEILSLTEVLKTDSVIMYGGERYHWYIAINPTKYRVKKTSYNADGVAVDNIYFDNIIHISLFQGKRQLFSRDFNKRMYDADVPEDFLEQAVLGNMQFDHIDASGFHFNATICIPDGASCYLVETLIDFNGRMTMKLLEY